jgi:hypothetical protein
MVTHTAMFRHLRHAKTSAGRSPRPALVDVTASIVAAGILAMAASGCGGSTGALEIVNVDGPGVAVIPWAGGPTIVVRCGSSRVVEINSAPSQPWLVTVKVLTDHHLLLQQDGSGDLEVIVRRGGALIGQPAASVGPASVGCAGV